MNFFKWDADRFFMAAILYPKLGWVTFVYHAVDWF